MFVCAVRSPEGKLSLYCKGADTIIYERLHQSCSKLMDVTTEHLNVSDASTYTPNSYFLSEPFSLCVLLCSRHFSKVPHLARQCSPSEMRKKQPILLCHKVCAKISSSRNQPLVISQRDVIPH